MAGEGFVFGVGVLGFGELDELDLLELVLANHAADVLAVGAGLGAKAGSVGAVRDGKLGLVERLVSEEIGDGDLGGGDEPVVVVLIVAGLVGSLVVAVEEVFGELRQLAGAEERLRVDHVGRQDFGVPVFAGVEVEHEVGEGAFEARSLAEVDDEARAGDLRGAVEVEDAEGFAQLPVGLGGKVELGLLAPGLFDAIGVFVFAYGDAVAGEVGQGLHDVAQTVVGGGCGCFERLYLGLE